MSAHESREVPHFLDLLNMWEPSRTYTLYPIEIISRLFPQSTVRRKVWMMAGIISQVLASETSFHLFVAVVKSFMAKSVLFALPYSLKMESYVILAAQ